MSTRTLAGAALAVAVAAVPLLSPPPAAADGGLRRFFGGPERSPAEQLARTLDEVEETLNRTGTVGVKRPDVWGESRLTRHRQEIEQRLAAELDSFQLRLQGSISVRDQAFLANALAIQATLDPDRAGIPTALTGNGLQTTAPGADQTTFINVNALLPSSDDEAEKVGIDRESLGSASIGTGGLGFAGAGVSPEPTVVLDQLNRYLYHLQELRRLNEGPDTADAPGYALNLVRIPVSILPGDRTKKGHGAVATMTASLVLTEDLLPSTFRTLVVQDLLDELALPVRKGVDAAIRRDSIEQQRRTLENESDGLRKRLRELREKQTGARERQGSMLADSTALIKQSNDLAVIAARIESLQPEDEAALKALTSNAARLISEAGCVLKRNPPAASLAVERTLLAQLKEMSSSAEQELLAAIIPAIRQACDESDDLASGRRQKPTGGPHPAVHGTTVPAAYQPPAESQLSPLTQRLLQGYQDIREEAIADRPDSRGGAASSRGASDTIVVPELKDRIMSYPEAFDGAFGPETTSVQVMGSPSPGRPDAERKYAKSFARVAAALAARAVSQAIEQASLELSEAVASVQLNLDDIQNRLEEVRDRLSALKTRLEKTASLQSPFAPGSPTRRARLPVSPTRIPCVFGVLELQRIARDFQEAYDTDCDDRVLHLTDVRAFLKEEIQAAYDYLGEAEGGALWGLCPEIARRVRAGEDLCDLRGRVVRTLPCGDRCPPAPLWTPDGRAVLDARCPPLAAPPAGDAALIAACPPAPDTLTALAWAVLVESALLDRQLNDDVARVAGDPGCACGTPGPLPYFGPDPPPEARFAFKEYVRCRFPVQVFALDPAVQEQNVADDFSLRRELQLAAALAFASGRATASNTFRFIRRVEAELETIDLNRTQVAFAHGPDVFGWRFRPRFQTPEVDSDLEACFRTLLVGGPRRDALLRDRRLEPGMRECVALVVMPSFVQHLRFDVRTHFYELADPDDVRGELEGALETSRKIRHAVRLAECAGCEADRYLPGELERLRARAGQLARKTPLQTVYARVPYENTTGGFELFSSGVTDLSPELLDFYGAPGIDPARETRLFLVGRNFSVHQTRVIAGNRPVEARLLSREIMEVVVPPGADALSCRPRPAGPDACGASDGCERRVEIRLATPYGVTGRLLVPVTAAPPVAAVRFAPDPARLTADYTFAGDGAKQKLVRGDFPQKRLTLVGPDGGPVEVAAGITLSSVTRGGTRSAARTAGFFTGDAPAGGLELGTLRHDAAAGGYLLTEPTLRKIHIAAMKLVDDFLKPGGTENAFEGVHAVELLVTPTFKADGAFRPTAAAVPLTVYFTSGSPREAGVVAAGDAPGATQTDGTTAAAALRPPTAGD